MRGHEGVDHQRVDPVLADRRLDRLDHGGSHCHAVAVLLSDDDLGVTAGVDEQAAADVLAPQIVLEGDRHDAALQLVGRVLAVPVPDPQRLRWALAQQVLAADHMRLVRKKHGINPEADITDLPEEQRLELAKDFASVLRVRFGLWNLEEGDGGNRLFEVLTGSGALKINPPKAED